jgi:hypothetical protein
VQTGLFAALLRSRPAEAWRAGEPPAAEQGEPG